MRATVGNRFLGLALVAAGCAQQSTSPPRAASAATAYAAALQAGSQAEVAALSSGRARSLKPQPNTPWWPTQSSVADRADAAETIRLAAGQLGDEVRAESPGSRSVRLRHEAGAWKLTSLPFGSRSMTVDEAVTSFLDAIDRRDPDALLLLLGDRREAVLRDLADRTEALRSKRGSTETKGTRARIRIGDSWWLLVDSTPAGWQVVGSEP